MACCCRCTALVQRAHLTALIPLADIHGVSDCPYGDTASHWDRPHALVRLVRLAPAWKFEGPHMTTKIAPTGAASANSDLDRPASIAFTARRDQSGRALRVTTGNAMPPCMVIDAPLGPMLAASRVAEVFERFEPFPICKRWRLYNRSVERNLGALRQNTAPSTSNIASPVAAVDIHTVQPAYLTGRP